MQALSAGEAALPSEVFAQVPHLRGASMPEELPELMTPEEVAKYLKVSLSTIRRLLRNKELIGKKVGDQWRIQKQQLLAYIESTEDSHHGNK